MKILISGATGYIGSKLANSMVKEGYQVCSIIRTNSDTKTLDQNISKYIFDGDTAKLTDFIKEQRFDGVVHLAALYINEHKNTDIDGLIEANILFGTKLAQASVDAGVAWFINTGSFGQHLDNKDYFPSNLYSATKQAFQDVIRYYAEYSKLNVVTVEISNTFGPDDTREKIINRWLKIAKHGGSLDVSPSKQILDICHIDDVVSAYKHLIHLLSKDTERKLNNKIFVINADKRYSLKKLSSIFEKVTGKKLNINWNGTKKEAVNVWSKGKRIPGWKPVITIEQGIKMLYEQQK